MTLAEFPVIGRRWSAALLLFVLVGTLWPISTSAHAFLDTSDPTANAVVATAPTAVKMVFTERIQPSASTAELYDSNATRVDTPPSHLGASPRELILPLPKDLPTGTYTVQWRNISVDDGHPNSGYFAFTVGGQANVVLPAPPPAPANPGIISLGSIARWIGLLGLAGLIGSLIVWHLVITPGTESTGEELRRRIVRRVRGLALASFVVALFGSGLLFVDRVQAGGVVTFGTIGETLTASRFGWLILARVVLLLSLATVAWLPALWAFPASLRIRTITLLACTAVPVPYALNSHSAALVDGGATAVTVDWLHLLAASIWIGGLFALVIGLISVRPLTIEQRRSALAEIIPRFSTLAIMSVIVLGLTGFYSAWLDVGNLNALQHTTYGRTLIVKLVLLIPLLLLGALNLLIVGPRLRLHASAARQFGCTLIAEAIIGICVLGVVGVLIALPTGREVLTFSSGHPSFQYEANGIRTVLQIYPGTVGINRYTADVQPTIGELPSGTQVFLRVSSSQITGQQQINLSLSPGTKGRYTAQGRELSIVGHWNLDLVVRRPNQPDWDINSSLNLATTPPAETAPGLPLRFLGYSPILGVLAMIGAIILVVAGLRMVKVAAERRFMLESSVALAVAGGLVLLLTRAPGLPASTGNPVPKTPDAVAAGKTLFLQHCVACHGTDGHGDGPLAAELNPPPADLYAAHVDYHTDRQLFDWIKGGFNGSAMPGFKGQMTDQQIWNVVNYVRSFRHPE